MSTTPQRSIADIAAAYVRQFGLALVPLPARSKRPVSEDWGEHLLTDPDAARAHYTAHPAANIGMALGPSRICSLDIDDMDAMRAICAEFGWDIDALVLAHPTTQGQAPGLRILFRVPAGGEPLAYHALTWPRQDDPKRRVTVFELRAADAGQQRQDVLPPSIHPDTGEPYRWITPPTGKAGIPEPPAWLLAVWRNWSALKPQLQDVCPWAPRTSVPAAPRAPRPAGDGQSVIDAYDAAHGIEETLRRYGYAPAGKRWLSPHSETKLPGVVVLAEGNRAWIHHASDPLCSTESGQPVAPFDLFAHYEHGGDAKKAAKAAAQALGMRMAPRPQQARHGPPRPAVDPETGEILDAANDNEPTAWPAPFDLFAEFPAPPITPDMLPGPIADYAMECGQLIGVEPAMVAMPAIVACAAALHDDVRIQPKRHETGWTESARLWCAIVGTPSVKKSPAIRRATKRLRGIDAKLAEANARAAAQHADQVDQYKAAKREAKKTGEAIPAPHKPAMHRMIVEDITVEALSDVLADNARGVLCIQDELSGWFGAMDAYNGGKAGNKDRAAWLQAYNGGYRQVDRVTRGAIHIPNFSVSMIGGIQPDAIRRIAKDMTDDGLMQRFMIVVGRNAREHDRPEVAEVGRAYAELVEHLHSVQPGSEPVRLCEGAHRVREQLMEYAGELADYPALPGGLRSHLGKWPGLFARLLLVYHAIECALAHVHPCTRPASEESAGMVDRLMRRFLLPHAIAYYSDILGGAGEIEHARWVAGYILSRNLEGLQNRDLVGAYKAWRGMDDWRRQRTMTVLEDMGWLVPLVDPERQTKRGATSWLVNPQVHAVFRARAAEEAQRRGRLREEIAAMQRRVGNE